jgi:hypothetical protein
MDHPVTGIAATEAPAAAPPVDADAAIARDSLTHSFPFSSIPYKPRWLCSGSDL